MSSTRSTCPRLHAVAASARGSTSTVPRRRASRDDAPTRSTGTGRQAPSRNAESPGVEAERHALDTTGGQHGRLVEALELLITTGRWRDHIELRDLGAATPPMLRTSKVQRRRGHGPIGKGRVGPPVAEGVGRFYVMGVVAPVPDLQFFIIINFETRDRRSLSEVPGLANQDTSAA